MVDLHLVFVEPVIQVAVGIGPRIGIGPGGRRIQCRDIVGMIEAAQEGFGLALGDADGGFRRALRHPGRQPAPHRRQPPHRLAVTV
ncbi:hypothetical protein GALL_539170 [mine drainage metagenome]|uniref:Uncharacterized protein n=1 Tax=mine drainage metagenome TaxID=410659 RepID=A0A1J5PAQ1_9ZZZZ